MMYFLTRFLLATLCAFGAAFLYGWFVVPDMMSTVIVVVPFLMLSIIAFIYIQQTGSPKAATVAYLIGLIPFLMWIGAIIVMFRNSSGPNDEMASVLLASYLTAAMGGYLCLILSGSSKFKRSRTP